MREQLEVTADAFWLCVQDGTLPDRGAASVPVDAIPADVVAQLIGKARLSEAEVMAMTKEQAIDGLMLFVTEGR